MKRARHSGAARRWWYLAWSGVLLLALVAGCAVKKPQVPRTKFQISIPVADDRTVMSEVLEGRDYLKLDSVGVDAQNTKIERLTLDFTYNLDVQQEIGDRLSLKPNGADFSTAIGDINLPGVDLPAITIPMSQLVPGATAGATVPIPATNINTEVPLEVENIEQVVIKEGGIDITFRNGLPVDLADMRLILVDRGAEVSAIDLGQVAKGSSKSGSFELAGKSITGELTIEVSGSTVAADAATIGSASALEVQATLRPLVATEAAALIPQQEFAASQALEFPDDHIQVTSALIREGKLIFEVTNNIPLVMQLDLSLDDLKKPDGSANVFRIERLNENATVRAEFDLEGNNFAPANPLELRFSYAAKTIPSTTPARIISGSTIGVRAITSTLAFSRVEGRLNRLPLPIPQPKPKTLDFPDGLENISLSNTELEVFTTTAVGFNSPLDLNIKGESKTGQQKELTIDFDISPSERDSQSDTLIAKSQVLRPSPGALTDFINLLPTKITVDPHMVLGKGGSAIEVIEPSHWIRIDSLRFRAPVQLRISADTKIQTDPQKKRDFNDATARERINSNLDSVVVITDIENHLPIGVRVSLMVDSTSQEELYTSPDLRIPEIEPDKKPGFGVVAGEVDQGRVSVPAKSHQEIRILPEVAKVFLREGGVYTGILIELDQTEGGSDIEVLGSDYVDVKAAIQVFLELNDDLVNGGN